MNIPHGYIVCDRSVQEYPGTQSLLEPGKHWSEYCAENLVRWWKMFFHKQQEVARMKCFVWALKREAFDEVRERLRNKLSPDNPVGDAELTGDELMRRVQRLELDTDAAGMLNLRHQWMWIAKCLIGTNIFLRGEEYTQHYEISNRAFLHYFEPLQGNLITAHYKPDSTFPDEWPDKESPHHVGVQRNEQ